MPGTANYNIFLAILSDSFKTRKKVGLTFFKFQSIYILTIRWCSQVVDQYFRLPLISRQLWLFKVTQKYGDFSKALGKRECTSTQDCGSFFGWICVECPVNGLKSRVNYFKSHICINESQKLMVRFCQKSQF